MKRKPIKVLEKSILETMHTGSLMARRSALLACEQSFEVSDADTYQVQDGQILYKESSEWKTAYDELKTVLGTREHWSKGHKKRER